MYGVVIFCSLFFFALGWMTGRIALERQARRSIKFADKVLCMKEKGHDE